MATAEPLDPRDVSAGINRLEGLLLMQAETARARESARDFTTRLPWLTTAQREEVERVYVQDRLDQSTQYLVRIANRCDELRSEYQARYETLRRRLTTAFILAFCAAVTFSLALTFRC